MMEERMNLSLAVSLCLQAGWTSDPCFGDSTVSARRPSAWAAAATAAEWMSRASGACGRAAHISRPHAVVAEGTVDAVDASASSRYAQGVRARVIRAVVRGKGMPTV